MMRGWFSRALLHLLAVAVSVVNTQSFDAPYQSGVIQNTESLSSLTSVGCTVCHVGGIGYHTTIAHISSCKGPYLFVGALSHKSSTFLIGAYALATEVKLETDSYSPHLSNGAYWHFNPRDSFGFSENTILNKISSHTEEHSIAHLSWTIDKNVKTENLRGIKIGEKEMIYHIFNCPDSAQLAYRRLADISSDDIPSGMPTPFTNFPTSNPTIEMPAGYPSDKSTSPSSAPTPAFALTYSDDDLVFGVSTEVDMETSNSTHYSLPTATLVVVIVVTTFTGALILAVSFLLFLEMRAVKVKSKSGNEEFDEIPIAHEVVWSKGPVLVVEANLASNS